MECAKLQDLIVFCRYFSATGDKHHFPVKLLNIGILLNQWKPLWIVLLFLCRPSRHSRIISAFFFNPGLFEWTHHWYPQGFRPLHSDRYHRHKQKYHLALEPQPDRSLGKYGLMRLRYLKEQRPGLFNRLTLSGKLYAHLLEIEDAANDLLESISSGQIYEGKLFSKIFQKTL